MTALRKHPIGLGPYKFVSHTPGIELVLEAVEDYWRKVPHVKRLVFKSVPEATTRMAMLKKGEVDLAYLLDAPLAEDVKRDPKLQTGLFRRHWHHSGWISSTSGIPNLPGMTSGCGWPPTTPSIARP